MYFDYNLGDWYRDWGAVSAASEETPKENSSAWIESYFQSKYANPLEAVWKCNRMIRAVRYSDKHHESFEAGSWVLSSSKSMTVGKDLVTALFAFFTHATDEQVINEPPPEIIMRTAQSCRKARGKD